MSESVAVLDEGFVRLDAVLADDLSVVNSARVSFAQRSEELTTKDEGLIKFLMREEHGTPFEHNFFRFHVKTPIFVAREWFRHRIGWSYNEWSGRYSEITAGAYTPNIKDMRSQTGSPGNYTYVFADDEESLALINGAYESSWEAYDKLLERGVAKELARSVLPVSTWTEFYATTNARALMHFLHLRNSVTAQYEIRVYAMAMEEMLIEHMPITGAAFLDADRRCP